MSDVVVETASRALRPAMMLASLLLLLRGHDEPGGGFIAGLVAAAALALPIARRPRRGPSSTTCVAVGLAVALTSGLTAAVTADPWLAPRWVEVLGVPIGTPLWFDLGVFLVVVGFVVGALDALRDGEEASWR